MSIEVFAQTVVASFAGARVSSMNRPGAVTAHTGNVSLHAVGRAVDIAAPAATMAAIFNWAVASVGSIGAQEVIYKRQIWTAGQGVHTWPHDDHHDHVHIGLTAAGVAKFQSSAPVTKAAVVAQGAGAPASGAAPAPAWSATLKVWFPWILFGGVGVVLITRR